MLNPLSTYSRESLSDVLRVVKDYKVSLRQVGRRAQLLDRKNPSVITPCIEFAPGIDPDLIEKSLPKVFKKYFPEYGDHTTYTLQSNPKLISGIRIYYGDDLVDLSFQKFTHLFH